MRNKEALRALADEPCFSADRERARFAVSDLLG
jgi:hypothetical protein